MNRRQFLRVKVDLPTHVAGEGDAESDIEGTCYSLGGGGFGFLLDRRFAVGSWLTVEIDLGGDDRVNARAVVVGCDVADDHPGMWRISTRLEELPDEDRRRLEDALHHPS